jgi:hypothetical protein
MLLTISHKTAFLIDHESIYLFMNHSTSHHMGLRVYHYDTFSKVLNVSSKWVVKGEELSMLIEQQKLSTFLQPNESQTFLAYWAWELPMNTPGAEYPVRKEVMQGVVVPKHAF